MNGKISEQNYDENRISAISKYISIRRKTLSRGEKEKFHIGENWKTLSSTSNQDIDLQYEDIEHSLTPYEKVDLEWIQDLNVNLESKFFEKQLHP